MNFAIGKKMGMTRVFDQDGRAIAVSVISIIPSTVKRVVNYKDKESVQLELKNIKNVKRYEFQISKEDKYSVGQDIDANNLEGAKLVNISGLSKGKGFSGVIKRHGFSRGPKTHGSNHHRAPGSIGGGYPQRVVKGRKMPGRMGANNSTIKNLHIFDIDKNEGILLVKGAIPGAKKSIIKIYS